jgi:hypothetical protein
MTDVVWLTRFVAGEVWSVLPAFVFSIGLGAACTSTTSLRSQSCLVCSRRACSPVRRLRSSSRDP